MKLLFENFRKFLSENSANDIIEIIDRLKEKGWDPDAIKYHKDMNPPFVEIEQIISNLDDYTPMKNVGLISSAEMKISEEDKEARQGRYDDYKAAKSSGEKAMYFRDTYEDPDSMEFKNTTPVTLIQHSDGSYEVVDGIHRVFLAQKKKAYLPAWVVKLK